MKATYMCILVLLIALNSLNLACGVSVEQEAVSGPGSEPTPSPEPSSPASSCLVALHLSCAHTGEHEDWRAPRSL